MLKDFKLLRLHSELNGIFSSDTFKLIVFSDLSHEQINANRMKAINCFFKIVYLSGIRKKKKAENNFRLLVILWIVKRK
jgi:hypothetical protein